MKLTQLVAKPQLVKITIDDEATIKDFGEAVEFWIYDRQPMEDFVKLATMSNTENMGSIVEIVNGMVLDEAGNKVMNDGMTLPTGIMIKVVGKVIETLGK
jgi:hypothetical protein